MNSKGHIRCPKASSIGSSCAPEMGYPDRAAERDLLRQHREGEPVDQLTPVLHATDIVKLQHRVREVRVADAIADYVLDISEATRTRSEIVLGASTRAAIGLYRAAQSSALLDGRDYVVPDDVKNLAIPVLAHRLIAKAAGIGAATEATTDAVRDSGRNRRSVVKSIAIVRAAA